MMKQLIEDYSSPEAGISLTLRSGDDRPTKLEATFSTRVGSRPVEEVLQLFLDHLKARGEAKSQ
jgi:hypothetical protein